ncbi:MAG: hypothetical protein ACRENI_05815 [Gemmatimonadaceae bacterium]
MTFELGVNYRSGVTRAVDVSADDCCPAPATHFERLYASWLSRDRS